MSIPNCYTAFNLLKKYRAYTSQLFQIHNVTLRSGGVTVAAVSWLLGVLRDLVLAVILVAAFSLWLSASCRCLVLVLVPGFF